MADLLAIHDRMIAFLDMKRDTAKRRADKVAARRGMRIDGADRAVAYYESLLADMKAARAAVLHTMPPREGFYLACFKHKDQGGSVLWWRPDNAGYSPDLEQAGIYTELLPGYHDSDHTVPVPVAFIEGLRVRRTVDPGDSLNQMFWSAAKLREALGTERAGVPVSEVDV